ncbi:hypothetical protein AMJ50_01815 [Parcubacteria bacterium DG_74_3]|nr:MAG: hypothetical protein AMJ50_01815 [Parcubacteria bacterium DG_74_3]
MAKKCQICGKTGALARRLRKLRGKYNPTIKRRQKPNLHRVEIPQQIKKAKFKKFAGQKVLACAKCIKTLGKRK